MRKSSDENHRLPTLEEYREFAEHTLRDVGSQASFDRLRATATELITRHDRVKVGNEFHDLLSEILRLAHQAGAEDFNLDEFLQEEAGNVKALGEIIKGMGPRAEAGNSNSENADPAVRPWLNYFRKMKRRNWGPYAMAKYALDHRPWVTDPDLVERSKSQLRRYANQVCKEWSARNSLTGFDKR